MIARTNLTLPNGEVVDVRVVVNDDGMVRLEAIEAEPATEVRNGRARLLESIRRLERAGSTNTTLAGRVEHHHPALNVGIVRKDGQK